MRLYGWSSLFVSLFELCLQLREHILNEAENLSFYDLSFINITNICL